MADITRSITLAESATLLLTGYGTLTGGDTNLTFVINGVEASEPLAFSPGEAVGTQLMIYGIVTLAAGDHTVALRGAFSDVTEGWIWVLVGEDTGENTIGVND